MRAASLAVALTLGLIGARPAAACLWDNDTFAEESLTDRDTAAVLRGELGHHGDDFYRAKIAYTRPIVDGGRAPKERYDDLAVALAKTGAIDDALAVLAAKDVRFPDEYTTHANRGTFLAMKGDAAGALVELRAALAINPAAHFGREEFQVKLLEYKLRLAKDPTLRKRETFLGPVADVMPDRVTTRHIRGDAALDRPIVAITGLIRFGGADRDPDLWYALGWALAARGDNGLALMAFYRAARLGHPRGAALVEHRVRITREFAAGSDEEAIAKAQRTFDATLARGAAAEARRQARETRLIARKRWRAAFGY